MSMRWTLPVLAAISWLGSSAEAQTINGYAVGNFRSCGASNLPGTIAELDKFFASSHFPAEMKKNFQWNDARVRASEWSSAHDVFASTETSTGFDGVDSGLISYIASHGVTSAAKYTALSGGEGGVCYIRTPDMSVGDQQARYLILSTCQGLKIGTGDDPLRAGENPQVTWANANQGLNCIFGYSNNMVDADQYGSYLLEALATSDDTLAEAFFRAAKRVSYANIPAALCFGADDTSARQNLETARRFTSDSYGKGGSAWAFDHSRRLDDAFVLPDSAKSKVIPREIRTAPRRMSIVKLAARLVGKSARQTELKGGLKIFRDRSTTATYDPKNGFLTWRKGDVALNHILKLSDTAAIRAAKEFLVTRSIVADSVGDFQATYVTERGAQVNGKAEVVAKTVIFHQRVRGLLVLATAGSIEVTVGEGGQVIAMTASLIDATLPRVNEWLDVSTLSLTSHKDVALRRVLQRVPGANVSVIESRVGYDVGDYAAMHQRSRVVVEVLVEADQGGFSRRFVEKVAL